MPKDDKVHLFLAETVTRSRDLENEIFKYDQIFNTNIRDDYNLKFATYQSAYRWRGREFGLVICDEIHDQLTPKYALFHIYNMYDAVLGLSATIERDTKYELEDGVTITKGIILDKVSPVCFTYTTEDARRDDTSRELEIIVITGKLEDEEKTIKAGSAKRSFMQTERAYYDYWEKRMSENHYEEDFKKRDIIRQACFRHINKAIHESRYKQEYTKQLLNSLGGKTIVFANSIDSLLGVTDNVVSSRNKKAKNDKIIDDFNSGKSNVIGSFKKLEQGANLDGLENVIIMSYYSKSGKIIQRIGRLRESGTVGRVFIYVTENTREGDWFNKVIESYEGFNVKMFSNINEYLKNK